MYAYQENTTEESSVPKVSEQPESKKAPSTPSEGANEDEEEYEGGLC